MVDRVSIRRWLSASERRTYAWRGGAGRGPGRAPVPGAKWREVRNGGKKSLRNGGKKSPVKESVQYR